MEFPSLLNLTRYNIICNKIEYKTINPNDNIPILTTDCIELVNEMKKQKEKEYNFFEKFPEIIHYTLIIENYDINFDYNHGIQLAALIGNFHLTKSIIELGHERRDWFNWFEGSRNAAKSGNLKLLKYILNCPPDMYTIGYNEIFFDAARHGHFEIVKFIIKEGISCKFLWNCGMQHAAISGNVSLVEFIILKGFKEDLYYKFSWNHGVNCAAKSGNLKLIEFMINKAIDSNQFIAWCIPVHTAIENNNKEMLIYLFDKQNKVDNEYKFHWPDTIYTAIVHFKSSVIFDIIIQKAGNEYEFDWTFMIGQSNKNKKLFKYLKKKFLELEN